MRAEALYEKSSELVRQAFRRAAEQLGKEWDGGICGVCGASKWPKFPFCRSCAITARRVGILRGVEIFQSHDFSRIAHSAIWMRWLEAYDRARDFLIQRRRDVSNRRNKNDEPGRDPN